ncbi:unnamed protein product [Rhizophagus irregularis]|nr:unnamed protein product [Rhizophagus irregularis]
MSSLVLACLIFDDPIENTFTIDINKNKQISHLKDAIKEKIEHRFEKIDANDLELWKEEHINIIVKPPAHIPKLDHAEATEDVKCPHCQATFKSKNRNYKKHKSTCKPNVTLGVDMGNGLIGIPSENVIPWVSSVSDKDLSQSESLCRELAISFSRSNDISHNRKEIDRLMLSAFGRTVSEAFSRNICVVCGVRPERFHNEASRQEYEKISGICPACWETETLPPDDTIEQIKRSQQILLSYGREFILCQQLPHAWKCLRCQKVIQGKERLTHAVKCREGV